jgi:hypothetical protein
VVRQWQLRSLGLGFPPIYFFILHKEASSLIWHPLLSKFTTNSFLRTSHTQFVTCGGCQKELAPNDQVLWIFDAYAYEGFNYVYDASNPPAFPPPVTFPPTPIQATAGVPFTLSVVNAQFLVEHGSHPEMLRRQSSGSGGTANQSIMVWNTTSGTPAVDSTTGATQPAVGTSDESGTAQTVFSSSGTYTVKAVDPAGANARSNGVVVNVT